MAILSRYKVRSHMTKAWRHQHSPELPEADPLPSILSDTKEETGVAFLAAKYVSGLAGLNALIVHGAPPNLGSPESRPPNLMNRVNILPWYTFPLGSPECRLRSRLAAS
jgi:hypothetical protein